MKSRDLGRERYRNSGGWAEMLPAGEYLDHHPVPQVAGAMGKKKRNDPCEKQEKEEEKKKLFGG